MASFREKVGERIRLLRKAAGLTQEQLARRAGMDYKYLGSVERGERNVTLDNVERIVRGLGVEPYEPFLFPSRGGRPVGKLSEEVLLNLARRTDPRTRALAFELLHGLLRWAQPVRKA